MKYMIASDLHGYSKFASILWEKMKEEKADKVILLGDYLSYGFSGIDSADEDTKKTITLLNENREDIAYAVMGNCDNEKVLEALHFPIEKQYHMILLDGKKVMFTHGDCFHENNIMFLSHKPDILIHGHTHIPRIIPYPEFVLLNPGSISIPRGGSRNSYMVYEEGKFTIKDIDGNQIQEYKM